jgi:hypothetical protein
VHVEAPAFGRGNAGRILAAMLEHHQAVVEQLVDRGGCDDTENSAHIRVLAYLNRIRLATSGGSQGLPAITAVSSGAGQHARESFCPAANPVFRCRP